ncbi:MAG TPA: hypothetical protein H9813_10250 [Candidatus Fournierella merdipullorum]|uniref:Uncharacterized protein n=1 Tax=Candidatus Allofournierella merdipullorum TaxID=2838595 RepID=A0A9D2E685_9FIRM|nr:hypothetical protein [Candidatus Fournierella merdipullorum]
MKGILKVFAVAAALAVLGITLMLMGFATGGPSAARQALNYTNLTQRHYHGWVPGWLERALGWSDEAECWAETFGNDMDRWAEDFEDDVDRWADDFENEMDAWSEDVEHWAEGVGFRYRFGWGPGICLF